MDVGVGCSAQPTEWRCLTAHTGLQGHTAVTEQDICLGYSPVNHRADLTFTDIRTMGARGERGLELLVKKGTIRDLRGNMIKSVSRL